MKVHNERKAGVILSYVNTAVGFIVSLAYTPIMLRLLGQSEYGVYQAAASVISYLSLFSLGFASAYMRFYARYKTQNDEDGIKKLNSLFLLVFSFAAILTLIAGGVLTSMPDVVFGTKFSSSELNTSQILLALMSMNMSITFIDSVFQMYINAQEKFTFMRILNILSTVLRPMVTLPMLLMGYGSVGLTVASTFVTVGIFIADIFYARKYGIAFKMGKPDFALLKEIAVFSFFIFISSVAATINGTIDKLLLGRYVGSEAVSVYEIGDKFNLYLMQFSVMISTVFVPKVNMMVAEKDSNKDLSDLMIRIGRIQFILLAFVLGGFILVGRFFINIYAGTEYDNSYFIAIIIMIASFVPYIQNVGIEIQKAKNKHVFRSVAYLLIAVANIGFSIPFIKALGINGAAVGTAVSLFLGTNIIMNIYYAKGIKLHMGRFWKSMLKPAAAFALSFIPCFVATRFFAVNSIIRMIIVIIVFSALYIITMSMIGANDYEKGLVKSFIPHFKKG